MAKSRKSVDLVALESEYRQLAPRAGDLGVELQNQLRRILKDLDIKLGFPIQTRIKEWSSIIDKFNRLQSKFATVSEVQDITGLRLILLFARDLDIVCSAIESKFNVIRKYDTKDRMGDDQFGYSSVHFVVKIPDTWLKVPTLASLYDLQAEIQVRTISQHIWAEASQALQYKQESGIPNVVRRSIHRVSAILEIVDLEFERVLAERDEYAKDVGRGPTDEILNVDLLRAIMDSKLPIQNKSGDEEYDELLGDLSKYNVKTSKDLIELIEDKLEIAMTEEAERVKTEKITMSKGGAPFGVDPKRVVRGVYYTFTGLVRVMMTSRFGAEFISK